MSRQALMPRMMRSRPESHCRKYDAIRESRIASSSQLEFLLCEGCVLGEQRLPAINDGGSDHHHDCKVWLEKLGPHMPTQALYVTHV